MYRLPATALCFLIACWIVGCGQKKDAAPALVKVNGTVKLDGKPMGGGAVRFSVPGQLAKSMEIKDGAFSGEAHVGKNQVDVVWEKDGPPHPMDPKTFLKVNTIADKFSGPKSVLSAEVTEAGPNEFKFEVTPK
jgi:hypothetical protein